MDSPEQWISTREHGAGSAALGELLAQEVLQAFNTLTTTSQTTLSGDRDLRKNSDPGRSPKETETSTGKSHAGDEETMSEMPASNLAMESIVHESLHPIRTPSSYGGHIKVDPNCHGMVVKVDSRSRTSSDLLQLQFFSSEEDMRLQRNPLRVMHGFVAERAARARGKGMEFFKIEEADSTSWDSTSSTNSATESLSALSRLALPPALVRQSSTSIISGFGSSTAVSSTSSSRRPALAPRAMARAMEYEVQQMDAKRKVRPKIASAPPTQGSSFRSFALPGVHELWFRFSAPPGSEKPPLQIMSLAGSLDLAQPCRIQASPAVSPGIPTSSEQEGNVSPEELGLEALFTSFDEEQADDAPLPKEMVAKSTESVDKGRRLKSGKALEQGNSALPGCLGMAADVFLSSGKWFYEATVESLIDSDTLHGEVDGCLVRIGWANSELAVSFQLGDAWKMAEGSFAWDTAGIGAESAAEGYEVPKASYEGGTSQRQSPGRRVPSTCDERSATALEEKTVKGARINPADVALPLPSIGGVENSSVFDEVGGNELSRMESESRSIEFPILGSDSANLGFGIGQGGFVWQGGRPRVRAISGFAASDVIGCAFDIDSGRAWFSVNGQWTDGEAGARKSAGSMKVHGWEKYTLGAGNGVRPCFSVRGKGCVSVNFGAMPFKYAPPGQDFMPVILRDVQVSNRKQERLGEITCLDSRSKVFIARLRFCCCWEVLCF